MAFFRSSALAVLRLVVSVFEVARGLVDNPPGTFLAGWALVVSGVAMQSGSWALIVGGALFMGVVVVGAARRS